MIRFPATQPFRDSYKIDSYAEGVVSIVFRNSQFFHINETEIGVKQFPVQSPLTLAATSFTLFDSTQDAVIHLVHRSNNRRLAASNLR